MNFQNAVLLTAAVLGLIEMGKTAVWGTNKQRAMLGIVVGAAFGGVFLMRYTAWAHEQVIGDKPLDDLGIASLVLVSIFVAGAASAAWKVLGAVTNIGANQLSETQQTALDTMAQRQLDGTAPSTHPAPVPFTPTFITPPQTNT